MNELIDKILTVCKEGDCLKGWWSDGYEFEPIYDEPNFDGIEIGSKNENIRWFNYCPECGRKL